MAFFRLIFIRHIRKFLNFLPYYIKLLKDASLIVLCFSIICLIYKLIAPNNASKQWIPSYGYLSIIIVICFLLYGVLSKGPIVEPDEKCQRQHFLPQFLSTYSTKLCDDLGIKLGCLGRMGVITLDLVNAESELLSSTSLQNLEGRSYLLLGAPGSGKTTILCEVARVLAKAAVPNHIREEYEKGINNCPREDDIKYHVEASSQSSGEVKIDDSVGSESGVHLPSYGQDSQAVLPQIVESVRINNNGDVYGQVVGEGNDIAMYFFGRQIHEESRIPIFLNLSSWKDKPLALVEWAVERLQEEYGVPRSIGQKWISAGKIVLLLDELDAVPEQIRPSCIRVINDYLKNCPVPIIVSTRKTEYNAVFQQGKLDLKTAVTIQPLTQKKVEEYLYRVGELATTLRNIFKEDDRIQELVTRPLMLNMLRLTCRDKKVVELPLLDFSRNLQQQVFKNFVDTRFEPKNSRLLSDYDKQLVIHWLIWLAQRMKKQNQKIFYLEHMQIDWLPEKWFYRFILCLLFGLAYGLFYGIIIGISGTVEVAPLDGFITGLETTLIIASFFTLLNSCILFNDRYENARENGLYCGIYHYFVYLLNKRSICGFIVGIGYALCFFFIPSFKADLLTSLINGAIFGAAYAMTGQLDIHIQLIDILSWSWEDFQKSFVEYLAWGSLCGFLFMVCASLSYPLIQLASSHSHYAFDLFGPWIQPFSTQKNFILSLILLFAIMISIAVGFSLPHGISRTVLLDDKRDRPNQGLWSSARNSILLASFFALLIFAIINLIIFLPHYFIGSPLLEPKYIKSANVSFGLAVFGIGGLFGGGFAYIKHMILRFLIYRAGLAPWNYLRFLETAHHSLLLRRDTGGYRFFHDLLLDYFALYNVKGDNGLQAGKE